MAGFVMMNQVAALDLSLLQVCLWTLLFVLFFI